MNMLYSHTCLNVPQFTLMKKKDDKSIFIKTNNLPHSFRSSDDGCNWLWQASHRKFSGDIFSETSANSSAVIPHPRGTSSLKKCESGFSLTAWAIFSSKSKL